MTHPIRTHAIRTRAIRPEPVPPAVPTLLGFIAGFVDICAYLGLFHIFVAQLTGSFVFAGAQLVSGRHELMAIFAIPAFFLAGSAATALAMTRAPGGRALSWVLGLECVLLGAMLAVMMTAPLGGIEAPGVVVAALLGIAAMGVQSAMVRLFLRGVPSTNVMTTNTTQLAIDATTLLLVRLHYAPADDAERKQLQEARERLGHYWPPMAGFVSGTAIGAICHGIAGPPVLAVPFAAACALLGWCAWRPAETARG